MKSKKVTINAPSQYLEDISYILSEHGSTGESINDYNTIKDIIQSDGHWDYIDESLLNPFDDACISGFFDLDADLAQLMSALNDFCAANSLEFKVETEIIDSAAWENEWKKYYKPIIINNVAIVPKWIDYEGEQTKVMLDPGLAFGTGAHESTSMCIDLMQSIDIKCKRVADIGCGSGILGITAVKLGADFCLMTDNDSQAIRAAKANCRFNNLPAKKLKISLADLVENNNQKYDIILANLTADLLIRLKEYLNRLIENNGYIIMSGIINGRLDEVLNAYKEYKILRQCFVNDWHAVLFGL